MFHCISPGGVSTPGADCGGGLNAWGQALKSAHNHLGRRMSSDIGASAHPSATGGMRPRLVRPEAQPLANHARGLGYRSETSRHCRPSDWSRAFSPHCSHGGKPSTTPLDPGKSPLPGGWTDFKPVDSSARQVFDQATRNLLGVRLDPLSVREQVVAGRNYQFLCSSTPIVPGAAATKVLVDIYQPLNGAPTVTSVTPYSP